MYKWVNLKTFMEDSDLPLFDHSRKWTFRPDRPPRRKIMYDEDTEDSSRKHQMSRQSSTENNHKKSKQDAQEKMVTSDTSDSSEEFSQQED